MFFHILYNMSLTNSSLPVVSANNTSTYYVSMQPVVSGKSAADFISPNLKFDTITNKITANNVSIVKNPILTTSNTKPTNPNVGDIWYDTSTDIQFQYTYDGLSYFWVDVSSLSLGGGLYSAPAAAAAAAGAVVSAVYLVVAGGGGGGGGNQGNSQGAGGGAGGLLQGSLTLCTGSYTITVGRGGNGGVGVSGACASNPGVAGINSVISGTGITTITAFGGGGGIGSGAGGGGGIQPACGGSGGGGYGRPPAGPTRLINALSFGSPGFGLAGTQGYPGGSIGPRTFPVVMAGGGGAGGKGSNMFGNCCAPPFGGFGTGNGGAGYTWPYNATTYAGGGGGGNYNQPTPAIGGPGGGGNGGFGCGNPLGLTTSGTLNTGGGGGGGGLSGNNRDGGVGGNGIVILGVPTTNFPRFVAPGATTTTPPAAPGMTLLTYTSPSRTTNATFSLTLSAP